ncbi:MAG: 30S ribosomal protein S20 [Oligoflexia bacterium]|nr:30S ribosomal protein S20 [Oligoflexia bacterium]
MANHKSAEKRARQALIKNARNKSNRSKAKNAEQKLNEAIEKKDMDLTKKLFVSAQSVLAKVAQTKAISKNSAARKTSRMATKIAKLVKGNI